MNSFLCIHLIFYVKFMSGFSRELHGKDSTWGHVKIVKTNITWNCCSVAWNKISYGNEVPDNDVMFVVDVTTIGIQLGPFRHSSGTMEIPSAVLIGVTFVKMTTTRISCHCNSLIRECARECIGWEVVFLYICSGRCSVVRVQIRVSTLTWK